MKLIPLSQGKFAKVDDADFEWLSQWKWCFSDGYAKRIIYLEPGKSKRIYMHRLIMGTPNKMETDHINRDRLDNQRKNLRICSSTENKWNTEKRRNNKSGYKGVSFHNKAKKWTARIRINGIYRHIGLFGTPEEAATAWDKASHENHGEFARTNF